MVKNEEIEYQDVDTCIQNLIALKDSEALVEPYKHAVESAIHWLEECTQKITQETAITTSIKEDEEERLLEIFLNTSRNLEKLTELLTEGRFTHAELAVYIKEHRDIHETE